MEVVKNNYEKKTVEKNHHLHQLKNIIKNDFLEGNCFYYHGTLELFEDLCT